MSKKKNKPIKEVKQDKSTLYVFGATLLIMLFGVGYALSSNAKDNNSGDISKNIEKAGQVVMDEWADYNCGHCQALYSVILELKDVYSEDEFVNNERYFPLNGTSGSSYYMMMGAEAAKRQGMFDEFDAELWVNGTSISSAQSYENLYTNLEEVAVKIGLDPIQFKEDFNDPTIVDQIQADYDEGVGLGIDGTPAIYINGEVYPRGRARDFESMKSYIDSILDK